MKISQIYKIPYARIFNLTGLPALTLPCGFANGLPIGLQLAGRAWDEATILRAAFAFEREAVWSGVPLVATASRS